jgi:hypothetical protein
MGGKPLKEVALATIACLKIWRWPQFFTRSPIPSTDEMNTKPTKEVLWSLWLIKMMVAHQ